MNPVPISSGRRTARLPSFEALVPSLIQNAALFLVGLAVLVAGAEALIRGAVRVARRLGISPLVIGLTLVGFGTSVPELVVNLSAALRGEAGLAVGTVVGANVANVGLILGLTAVVRPLAAHLRLLRVEVPAVVAASLALLVLSRDGELSRLDGAALLAGFSAMAVYLYRSAGEEPAGVKEEIGHLTAEAAAPWWAAPGLIVAGIAGLIGGAHLMVGAAVEIAEGFGVSRTLVGLTVVALGTTSPELATTVSAARRGESDIAVGNVVGSSLFNVLLVLGTTSVVSPLRLEGEAVLYDMAVMCLFAVLLVPILLNGLKVHRWEGGLLLAGYAAFLGWQITRASR